MYRGVPDRNPNRIPIQNPDGTIRVHCNRCGGFICNVAQSSGYSSAVCYYCENGKQRPTELMTAQEELLMSIFHDESMSLENKVASVQEKKKFNILDMVINSVKALGFRRKNIEEGINQEEVQYQTADNETSKQVARRKKREPIFDKMKKDGK